MQNRAEDSDDGFSALKFFEELIIHTVYNYNVEQYCE
jgi:hypothetical protein